MEERDLSGVEPEEKIKTKGESCKKNRIRAHKEKKSFAPGAIGQCDVCPLEVVSSLALKVFKQRIWRGAPQYSQSLPCVSGRQALHF